MNGKSHARLGAMAGVLVVQWIGVDDPLLLLGGATVGAIGGLAPDLDHPRSILGRHLPRWFHRLTPGHRGITHSLVWALLAALSAAAVAALLTDGLRVPLLVGVAALAGILSHLAADGITAQGVPWLYPWSRDRYALPEALVIRTGGLAERVIVGVAWAAAVGTLLLTGGAR